MQKGYNFIQQQLPPNLDGYFAEEENKEAVQEKTDGDAAILGKTDGHTRTETESTDSSNEKTDLTDKAGPAIHEASIHKEGTEKNVLATKADSDEEPATENPDTLLAVDIEAAHPPGKQETVVREADKEEKDEIDPVEKVQPLLLLQERQTLCLITNPQQSLPFGQQMAWRSRRPPHRQSKRRSRRLRDLNPPKRVWQRMITFQSLRSLILSRSSKIRSIALVHRCFTS